MLDRATETLKKGEHPLVPSDRGTNYRWPGWISRGKSESITLDVKEELLARQRSL